MKTSQIDSYYKAPKMVGYVYLGFILKITRKYSRSSVGVKKNLRSLIHLNKKCSHSENLAF